MMRGRLFRRHIAVNGAEGGGGPKARAPQYRQQGRRNAVSTKKRQATHAARTS